MSPTDAAVPAPGESELYDRRWWALAVLCLSLLIVFVGNSSLNVAIPTLSRDLHATESQLQWVVAIYSLVFAGLLFTTGALGDRFGRKGALQFGLVLFLVGAILATESTEMWQLIGSRAVMGAAGALIMPSTLSIIINIFPAVRATEGDRDLGEHHRRGRRARAGRERLPPRSLLVRVGVPRSTCRSSSWRSSPGSSSCRSRAIPRKRASTRSVHSFRSSASSRSCTASSKRPTRAGRARRRLTAFAIAVVVLALFVAWELHVDEPMLDMHFFRNPAFSTGTGGMILVFVSMYGVMFLISQYFQLVLGYTALTAALRLLPIALIMLVVAPFTPRLSARFGAHRTVSFGMLSIATGLALFTLLTPHTSYAYVVVCVVPLTAGIALSMSPMTASIMMAVPAAPGRCGLGDERRDARARRGARDRGARQHRRVEVREQDRPVPARPQPGRQVDGQHVDRRRAPRCRDAAGPAQNVLTAAADHTFVGGIHLAVTVGAILALISAGIVYRYLPHSMVAEGAMRGPVESVEDAAELGIAGVPPLFADDLDDAERSA